MKRLQTYFSLLVVIFTITVGLIAFVLGAYAHSLSAALWVLSCVVALSYLVSLVIGHFIAQSLTRLHLQADAVLKGRNDIDFSPRGALYEADLLARDFATLAHQTQARTIDLARKQQRQTQFISDVAHEIRTPLTGISGSAEALADPDMPPELRERFCASIVSESQRLTRLANELLTLHHIEEGTEQQLMQPVDLRSIALKVKDALESVFAQRHACLIIEGEAPDVLGIPDRIEQVIYNLVANASRFVKENGKVTVALQGVNNMSVVSVSDDGPGFGEKDPRLLFERFYRGDNSRARSSGGTGLGLAIVKSIVEAHDGTIEALNRAEGGATFIVAIPSIH